jgi:two-component system OmpR family response regulator
MRILIAEDDAILGDAVLRTVQQLGHDAQLFTDGLDALRCLGEQRFDLVLLDIGLPGIDGIALLRHLRSSGDETPVMLLTARDGIGDRIAGLDLGADDYLVKPMALSELAARIRARLRRQQLAVSAELTLGPLRLDSDARRAWLSGAELALTTREWGVLEHLMRRPGRVVSKEQVQRAASGEAEAGYNAAEVYVSRLRAKLEPAGVRIRTVRGFGYMLEDQPEA